MPSNVYNNFNIAIPNSDLERENSVFGAVNVIIKHFCGNASSFLHQVSDVYTIRDLLRDGAGVNAVDDDNLTPLHYAVTYDKGLEVIRELLSHGAKINAQDNKGFTPLTLAILFRNLDVIAELIRNGADFDIQIASSDFQYPTSLGIAVTKCEYSAKILIKTSLLERVYVGVHKPIDLQPYEECPNFKILSTYQDECIKELLQMKLYQINDRTSLYDFVMNKRNTIKPLYSCKKFILEDISSNFPIYCDTILPSIKLCLERAHLLDQFRSLPIFVNSTCCFDKKQIIVDPDSMYKIGAYMSNDDLMNCITASINHKIDQYLTCPVKPNYLMDLIPRPGIESDETLESEVKRRKISVH